MKFILPLALLIGSPALGHTGAHLHPHETNGWALGALLIAIGLAAGYVLGRIRS